MAGHVVTPYEVTATRKFARKNKDTPLELASIGEGVTVDLLDAVDSNILGIEPLKSTDGSRRVTCAEMRRNNDTLAMVFAADVSGEREVVHDGADPARPVIFTKGDQDVTRFYSCCLLWRPAPGTAGILLVHSPWGRGGSRSQIVRLIQRAVDQTEGAKAKISADALVPAKILARILRQAKATKITYRRTTGITSTFGDAQERKSAPAEIDLVVKGSGSIPYRDALAAALKATANREKLFTVRVRNDDGGYREETFDDVAIDIPTAGGTRRYSMRDDTLPTIGFNLTPEINSIYYGLPDGGVGWPKLLLDGVVPLLQRRLTEVRTDF